MIAFSRDGSGLYLADDPANARVAFLFQDASRTDPTFDLTAASWVDPAQLGFIALFAPSATRDWAGFATRVRAAFTASSPAQIGWFSDVSGTAPVLVLVDGQGTAQPSLSQAFSLQFRASITFTAQPDQFGGTTTVLFDDAAGAIAIAQPQSFTLTFTPPTGASRSFNSSATSLAIPLAGTVAGTLALPFSLNESALARVEAGLMVFEQTTSELVTGLRYPTHRPASDGGTFAFDVCLDVLAPLDPTRTYWRFTDTTIGSYFASASGKPVALTTTAGATASRLVLASRPLSSPTDARYFYLTPAGRFGLAADPASSKDVAVMPTHLLCGVTGTEMLRVTPGADALEFVPGQPAWREAGTSATAAIGTAPLPPLSGTASTSWVRIVSDASAYVSQPERSPLFVQPTEPRATMESGLDVHVLDFAPTESWTSGETDVAPLAPIMPYGGLDFASDPNLDASRFLAAESFALNPTRSAAYVGAEAMHRRGLLAQAGDDAPRTTMTPQGMLVSLKGDPAVWDALQMAVSGANASALMFEQMGPTIRRAVGKNQIFTVVSVDPAITADPVTGVAPLFVFSRRNVEIGGWTFDLSPAGASSPAPDSEPPIFILKFYPGRSIESLVDDLGSWSDPGIFNADAAARQSFLKAMIAEAKASVYPNGATSADETSLFFNFYLCVTDPTFSGILACNCNMRLDLLPDAIRGVLGGMKSPGIGGFRVHHVGVAINDTDPAQAEPTLSKSATFALVDYEGVPQPPSGFYDIDVSYLRALFLNSELRDFSCLMNLSIGNLFGVTVSLKGQDEPGAHRPGTLQPGDDAGTTIAIAGSYQAHDAQDGDAASGQGVFSFVSQKSYAFTFQENAFLDTITLTKLQFSFDEQGTGTVVDHGGYSTTTSPISAHFGIFGQLTFKEMKVLDVLALEQLVFSDLGITVDFDLAISTPTTSSVGVPLPSTSALTLGFAPGDLRLDLDATLPRSGASSLLSLLPFKLTSFLYSQNADQTLGSLNYVSLGSLPGLSDNGLALGDTFNYALAFDLDLGSMGGLVGALSAFKFSALIGWSSSGGTLAFGLQLPQVDGKLEIKIEGVLTISIEQMNLVYAQDADPAMLVLGLHDCFVEVLGKRLPPEGTISIGLFAPTQGADRIGWIGAFDKGEDGGGGDAGTGGDGQAERTGRSVALRTAAEPGGIFALDYLGLGQRVGPGADDTPTDFDGFLTYMRGPFWEKLKAKEFSAIYHPDGRWLALAHFTLLGKVEIGFVFYDGTPFYSLQLKIVLGGAKGFSFEITYTKVTDSIGLFAAKIALPDSLRTFEVGAASVTLPNLGIGVYTNGDFKLDIGFPADDDWTVCFRVEAMAGPVPVTGSGGFYVAKLSSATDPDVFKGDYPTILAFGFGARLGVGKDFTAGPLKAGVSLTFFGIIQGAAGYLSSGAGDIFKTPDALSLQGQFGIIGELYGSVDFILIKASVNVRLQASIGIVLAFEPNIPGGGDGSVLLYIEASVSVSATVTIDLFLFSVDVSFSFKASIRFQWQLAGSSSSARLVARLALVEDLRARRRLAAPADVALCPGLSATLPLLFLPEITVVFADAIEVGAPWFVVSLGVPYDPAPATAPTYADFKPFEAIATQLATFALMHALGLSAWNATVPLTSSEGQIGLEDIDGEPDLLVGWLDYPTLLGQLALFQAGVAIPTQSASVTAFPMPPFLHLATQGRDGGELGYQFSAQNPVTAAYLQLVDTYFAQLLVNATSDSSHAGAIADRMRDGTTAPLCQEIFLDHFKGVVRGAVHELLVSLQTAGAASAPLDSLFTAAVGAGRFKALAGQMASVARGGARLPYTPGLTVPGGAAQTTTNPLYSLLWQQFPVGGFTDGTSYTVALTNPDTTQRWCTADIAYTLEAGLQGVGPYTALHESDVTAPGAPTPIAETQTSPQSFGFANAIVFTPAVGAVLSLRPFPPSLVRLQQAEATAIDVLVSSRATDGAYGPAATLLPAADVAFATRIDLQVKRIPGAAGSPLPDVYGLSGASQADETLLARLIAAVSGTGGSSLLAGAALLMPPATGTGLVSPAIDPASVFVLRTNTSAVSQPPRAALLLRAAATGQTAVGASFDLAVDGGLGLLQIVQQATVTNAAGYYLRTSTPPASHSLPPCSRAARRRSPCSSPMPRTPEPTSRARRSSSRPGTIACYSAPPSRASPTAPRRRTSRWRPATPRSPPVRRGSR